MFFGEDSIMFRWRFCCFYVKKSVTSSFALYWLQQYVVFNGKS